MVSLLNRSILQSCKKLSTFLRAKFCKPSSKCRQACRAFQTEDQIESLFFSERRHDFWNRSPCIKFFIMLVDTLCSVLTLNLPHWLPISQTFLTGDTRIPVAFLQLCLPPPIFPGSDCFCLRHLRAERRIITNSTSRKHLLHQLICGYICIWKYGRHYP